MEVHNAVSGVHEALGLVFLWWATDDGLDSTFNKGKSLTNIEVNTEKCFGWFRSVL